jgi:hypothetical protein
MKAKFPPHTVFAIDFDGTCVTHEFPKVGKDCPYAVDVLKMINKAGGKLILWTMRSDHTKQPIYSSIEQPKSNNPVVICKADDYLKHAIEWFNKNDIPLYSHQCNPEQVGWTSSPKCYAHTYIDDAALGCPLIIDAAFSDRPYVDWLAVMNLLFE